DLPAAVAALGVQVSVGAGGKPVVPCRGPAVAGAAARRQSLVLDSGPQGSRYLVTASPPGASGQGRGRPFLPQYPGRPCRTGRVGTRRGSGRAGAVPAAGRS